MLKCSVIDPDHQANRKQFLVTTHKLCVSLLMFAGAVVKFRFARFILSSRPLQIAASTATERRKKTVDRITYKSVRAIIRFLNEWRTVNKPAAEH